MNKGLVVNRGQQRRSTAHLFSPDSQLRSALPCQATPQPAGGNLQLQHLSRINSSASTLKASRCTGERCRGLAGTCGQGLARVKGNKTCFIHLPWCRFFFLLCGNCRFLVNTAGANWTKWMIQKKWSHGYQYSFKQSNTCWIQWHNCWC